MIQNIKKLLPVFAISTALFGLAGCAEKNNSTPQDLAAAEAGLPVNSPDVVAAKSWSDFTIDANGYKTVVSVTGHYISDMKNERSACNKHSDGAYDLAPWNAFAATVNQIVMAPTLTAPRCVDSPNGSKFLNDGIVDLNYYPRPGVGPSKLKLFEYKNAQICSYISNAQLSDQLMQQIELQINTAYDAAMNACSHR